MENLSLFSNYPFMQIIFLGSSVFAWLAAIIVFFVVMGLLKIIKVVLIVKLKALTSKTKTDIDDMVIGAVEAIHWPFYVYVAFYIALNFINVHYKIEQIVYYIFIIALVYYVIKAGQRFIDFGLKKIIAKRREAEADNIEIIKMLGVAIKIGLWAIAIVLILSNLGYNVTSLIAGLGIGGIAVALALQNILSDLFSSLSIYFDKPFKIGDFVVLGDQMGTVKKVGVKTTRIQLLQGEELVVANSELTNSQLRNFGVMEKRRIVFNVGVTYDTPAEKLKRVPGMIKKIIASQEMVKVDRIHFKAFGDSSLIYEIVYYVGTGDYAKYMDIQQAINLAIVEKFEEEKIEIAFPTQTVYVKK